jgi:hypothetical protein
MIVKMLQKEYCTLQRGVLLGAAATEIAGFG